MPNCPKCGAPLDIIEDKFLKCPGCGAKFRLPKSAPAQTEGVRLMSDPATPARPAQPAPSRPATPSAYAAQPAPQQQQEPLGPKPVAPAQTAPAQLVQQAPTQTVPAPQAPTGTRPATPTPQYAQPQQPYATPQQPYVAPARQTPYAPYGAQPTQYPAQPQQQYPQYATPQYAQPQAPAQQPYAAPLYPAQQQAPAQAYPAQQQYPQQPYAAGYAQTARPAYTPPPSIIPSHNWAPVSADAVPCLKIQDLSKQYSQESRFAVKDLSLTCYPGEIVGLLGHNGAGKSTTLKCLTGMLPFDKGTIEINGFDIKQSPVKAKYTFGFVSDKHDVFVKMTGVQYVNFMADAYGVSKSERKERLEELDKVFTLGDRLHDPINSYSHGMRQKVCMLGSLIHYPKLWIMDEPMIGLDPVTSARVSAFMLDYAAKGNCILFSSHNISSVQKLCKRAVIINHGVKTDDFEFADFLREHPGINLEDYFLSRTEGTQDGLPTDGEVAK